MKVLELPRGHGRIVNGAMCAFGFAIRVGLNEPTRENAAQLYPLFDLFPGEHRPEPGEVVDGVPVFAWATEPYVAKLTGAADRTVRDWIRRGAPHREAPAGREYPVPHIGIWHGEYQAELRARGRCDELRFALALARHRLRVAEWEAAG